MFFKPQTQPNVLLEVQKVLFDTLSKASSVEVFNYFPTIYGRDFIKIDKLCKMTDDNYSQKITFDIIFATSSNDNAKIILSSSLIENAIINEPRFYQTPIKAQLVTHVQTQITTDPDDIKTITSTISFKLDC